MYRLAVLQNNSEMLRYGWADIGPRLRSFDYNTEFFSGETVGELISCLQRKSFDALLVGTNALNDRLIFDAFRGNSEVVAEYVESGGGICVLLQKRLTELKEGSNYFFLPNGNSLLPQVKLESHLAGQLSVPDAVRRHFLLCHPNVINADELSRYCLENPRLRSLYRAYCEVKETEHFETLIEDVSYGDSRALLVHAQPGSGRVVVSSLVLDWQDYHPLLENIVRYVVEGKPEVLVIEKRGALRSRDFKYLESALGAHKIPHTIVRVPEISGAPLTSGLYNTVLLDPSWTAPEIGSPDLEAALSGSKTVAVVWRDAELGALPARLVIGCLHKTQEQIEDWVSWIESEFLPGGWEESFWRTFDVLEGLVHFHRSLGPYASTIIARVRTHDMNGSYDELLGATCALLKVYYWLLGPGSEEYKQTLEWVQREWPQSSLFYEQATAISTLVDLNEKVDSAAAEAFVDRVGHAEDIRDTHQLLRFGRTLLAMQRADLAVQYANRLIEKQRENGSWGDLFSTASVLSFLLDVCILDQAPAAVDRSCHLGAIHLDEVMHSREGLWGKSPSATAKACVSLAKFADGVTMPVEDTILSLRGDHALSLLRGQVERATRVVGNYRERVAELERQGITLQEELKQEHAIAQKEARQGGIAILSVSVIGSFVVLFGLYVLAQKDVGKVWGYLAGFIGEWALVLFGAYPVAFFLLGFAYLRRKGLLPKWVPGALRGSKG